MKLLDDFLPSIRPYAPGVADPTAYFAIRQAAIEFCERTRLWRFEDEFQVNSEDADGLMAPPDAVVHEIESAWFDDHKLTPQTTRWLDRNCVGWQTGLANGFPQYVTQKSQNEVSIAPRGTGTVRLVMFLKPSQDADEVPDFLVDQHRETIAQGALARILMIPNQSFTSPDAAMAYSMAFGQALDRLSAKGFTGQQRAPVRVRPSFF